MDEIGEFFSVKSPKGPFEFKEKGSRFISFIYPVSGKEEAEEIIEDTRKKYYDSTHVCFGYRTGTGIEKKLRYSDDGEPAGTAGLPIINELKGRALFNALIVVIRYYGGTKLGTGGLARAYRESAKIALDNSGIVRNTVTKTVTIHVPFELESDVIRQTDRFGIKIVEKKYTGAGVIAGLEIPVRCYTAFRETLTSLSKGKIRI